MRRREILALLAGGVAWSHPAEAWAQWKKMPVIGFLGASSSGTAASLLLPAFRRGLEELGFAEGQNVVVEYVWADAVYHRLPALAAELVRRRVDVIVAAGGSIVQNPPNHSAARACRPWPKAPSDAPRYRRTRPDPASHAPVRDQVHRIMIPRSAPGGFWRCPASEGARFEVYFEKTRGFTGPDAEPFEA